MAPSENEAIRTFLTQMNIFKVNYKNTKVISNNVTLYSGLYDVYTVNFEHILCINTSFN